jgi:biotin carboxylase
MADTNKTVLIFGAGVMQLPAIRIAREKGWKVLVADGNLNAPGAGEADVFVHADLKDKDLLLERAGYYKRTLGLDGVFTAGTDFSSSVAYVAERLGLPGIPYSAALNATDKSRMREIFKSRNIPCPEFRGFEEGELEDIETFPWRYPLVVKPVDNMGARGVERVDTAEDLREKTRKAMEFSRIKKIIVEEYIEGPEFSIDAVVFHGEITICGIADRHIHFPPCFVELGHTMPSEWDGPVLERITEVFCRGVRSLGITLGAAKGDIFLSKNGPVIGEIAARLSGGYMSGWTYPYATGVRVTSAALNIALGLPPGDLRPKFTRTSAERAFISIPGRLGGIYGIEDARATEGVRDLFCNKKAGDPVKFPENNVEKCGNIISSGADRDSAVRAAETAAARIFLRLEAGNEETERFLFRGNPARHPAYSFPLPHDSQTRTMPWTALSSDNHEVLFLGPFKILAIDLSEEVRDWNYRSPGESVAILSRTYRGTPLREWTGRLVLGMLFWQAFLRGGLQGAAWVLDTLYLEKDFDSVLKRCTRWHADGK